MLIETFTCFCGNKLAQEIISCLEYIQLSDQFFNQQFTHLSNKIKMENEERTLVLMRGVPGSGKSTKAKKISGTTGLVYSTDDFFMKNSEYVYDVKFIAEYHQKNLKRTIQAMQKSLSLIIVDNTNIKLWQMRKYVQEADKYQYEIKIEQPQTDWAWNHKKCAKTNTHGVPEDKIKIMIQNYEPYISNLDEIRNAKDNRRRNGNKNR